MTDEYEGGRKFHPPRLFHQKSIGFILREHENYSKHPLMSVRIQ
jgi:hypothetical protein